MVTPQAADETIKSGRKGLVSVVIPCYRSQETIAKVVRLTRDELAQAGYDSEFILVNDCSPDGTFAEIQKLAEEGLPVTGIDLSRNFGQHAAIMAGLRFVKGDLALLMDDDMQTHPSQARILLQELDDPQLDVVFARYPVRKEALWRRLGSWFTRWTMRVMARVPSGIVPSSYVALRKGVVDAMVEYTGPFPFITGLIFQSTSRVGDVPVEHFDREVGTSGYTLRSLVRLWSTILNFSMAPLRLASIVGSAMGFLGLCEALYLVIRKYIVPGIPVGWSSTMVAILVCSGMIILFMGIVGEYVGRIFMTANHTPQYIIRKRVEGDSGNTAKQRDRS